MQKVKSNSRLQRDRIVRLLDGKVCSTIQVTKHLKTVPEGSVRRLLTIGKKAGVFTLVSRGHYTLTKQGQVKNEKGKFYGNYLKKKPVKKAARKAKPKRKR